MRHVRLLPLVVGAAATAGLVHLLAEPEAGWARTGAVVTLGAVAVFFGGLGLVDLVLELRRRRWRGATLDGRDRALVVMLGRRVGYGFGEALRYEPVEDLGWAAALDSARAATALPALRAALRESWLAYLRRDLDDATLFAGDDRPEETWALLFAAAVLGLAGRGELKLLRGRYVGWGRGRAKMKDLTAGLELALARAPAASAPSPDAPLERALLELADGDEYLPARLEDVARQLVERGLAPLEAPRGSDAAAPEVVEAWRALLDREPELLTLAVEHAIAALRAAG